MSATICGYDRALVRQRCIVAALRDEGLDVDGSSEYRRKLLIERGHNVTAIETVRERCVVVDAAIYDPVKLAAIIAELLRERGHAAEAAHATDKEHDADTLFLIGAWPDSIVVNWFGRRDGYHAWKKKRVLDMPAARTFALALLNAPADADVEKLIMEAQS